MSLGREFCFLAYSDSGLGSLLCEALVISLAFIYLYFVLSIERDSKKIRGSYMFKYFFVIYILVFSCWGCGSQSKVRWKVQTMDQNIQITNQKPVYRNGKYKVVGQNGKIQWIDENQIKLIDKVVKK